MILAEVISGFRDGLARGELLVQKCEVCSKLNMYPRYACPHCQSTVLGWKRVGGIGRLHSFTVLRVGAPQGFESDLPYALGVVKLEEGVQLLARLAPDATGGWGHYKCDDVVEFVAVPPAEIQRRPCATFCRVGL
jgi:uncharacterized OB-fold protein